MCNYDDNKELGFIKLFRSFENWSWYKDLPCFKLFIHFLIKANNKDKMWRGKEVKRGQFVTSYKHLAAETGLSIRQIRTAVDKLKLTGEIEQKTTNKWQVVTIVNYELYQQNEKSMTIKCQTNDNQMTTTKESNIGSTYIGNNTTTYIGTNNICDKKTKIFKKPTIEEIKSYCTSRGNSVNPNLFYDYYESNGWQVGKNKMKDWKAAVRTWENKKGYSNYEKPKQQTIKYRTV